MSEIQVSFLATFGCMTGFQVSLSCVFWLVIDRPNRIRTLANSTQDAMMAVFYLMFSWPLHPIYSISTIFWTHRIRKHNFWAGRKFLAAVRGRRHWYRKRGCASHDCTAMIGSSLLALCQWRMRRKSRRTTSCKFVPQPEGPSPKYWIAELENVFDYQLECNLTNSDSTVTNVSNKNCENI